MKKPIIAISGDRLSHSSKFLNENYADIAPRDLKNAIVEAGGVPIILPYLESPEIVAEMVQNLIGRIDGLIIPGGPDVSPHFYGEEPTVEIGSTNYLKDSFEIELIKAAESEKIPVLGICRGLQIINVAFGGTLYQDINSQDQLAFVKHQQDSFGAYPTHHIHLNGLSALTEIYQEQKEVLVNSRHHQAVKTLAPQFEIIARAIDGVVEAIESKNHNILAVQWHPENMWQTDQKSLELFQKFIQNCSK